MLHNSWEISESIIYKQKIQAAVKKTVYCFGFKAIYNW